MSSPVSAQIIPFPSRVPAAAPAAAAPDPQERLARALTALDAALSEQRTAMAGWRESLDQLRKTTNGLGLTMQRYHQTLGKLGSDVTALNQQARKLEAWADNVLQPKQK